MIMAALYSQALARLATGGHVSGPWQGLILVWLIAPDAILGSSCTQPRPVRLRPYVSGRETVQSRATWPDMSAWVMPSGCPAGHWTSSIR